MAFTSLSTTYQMSGSKIVVFRGSFTWTNTSPWDSVLYDASAAATAGGFADTLNSNIQQIWFSVKMGTLSSIAGVLSLQWDANTPVLALPLGQANCLNGTDPRSGLSQSRFHLDFREFGGLKNTAGAGKTGDIRIFSPNMTFPGGPAQIIMTVKPNG